MPSTLILKNKRNFFHSLCFDSATFVLVLGFFSIFEIECVCVHVVFHALFKEKWNLTPKKKFSLPRNIHITVVHVCVYTYINSDETLSVGLLELNICT
jgi:hypothetical protein